MTTEQRSSRRWTKRCNIFRFYVGTCQHDVVVFSVFPLEDCIRDAELAGEQDTVGEIGQDS